MADLKGAIYKIEDISKIFGHRYVLNNVNFDIKIGEIFGILGTSGSGKTTLLNSLVGFLKVERGDIKFRDVNVLNQDDEKAFRSIYWHQKELKKTYGFAPQTPSFYPNLTIKENLCYFGSLYNLPKKLIESNLSYLLNLVGLTQSQYVVAKRLSGGMQRRLDIACSLIHDPKILLLDEPTADLDPLTSSKIWNLLKIINQRGTTIIIASHHIANLEQLCNRVLILKEGHIVALGKPEEIKMKNIPEENICFKSYPGKYEQIIKALKNKFLKEIKDYEIKNKTLIIHTTKPPLVIHELLKVTEELNEGIIELELIKPTLDKAFIMIQENSINKEIKIAKEQHKKKKLKKHRHHHKKHFKKKNKKDKKKDEVKKEENEAVKNNQ
ncbi:MAG: ABC transporter ATP-binding protein [Nanoarchaeota archaeon]|nr:ABC transporter ATP-binding protein [Nanoarchaeota archaeon]MBU1631939.1 ABC transporter ATP-binding protein [Nanoarchaeota archaeon]MBU1875673.1 ABC transporter ATP-binding protein [Nanoarchaeota archaeon]